MAKTDKTANEQHHLAPYQFEKGKSGNPNGRPKGISAASKIKKQMEVLLNAAIESLTKEDALEKIQALDYKDRVAIIKDLSEFIVPKLNRTTLEGDPEHPIQSLINLHYNDKKIDLKDE